MNSLTLSESSPRRGKGSCWRTRWTAPPTRCCPFPHTPTHSDHPLATSQVWTHQLYPSVCLGKEYPNFRLVASTLRAGHFFGSLDPKNKSYEDMIGKTVAIGLAPSPHGVKGEAMLRDCYEILDQVKKKFNMAAPDITDALVDGLVDFGLLTINPATPQWMPDEPLEALRARRKVYAIPLTLEQGEYGTAKGKYNFMPIMTMPANTLYEGQPETPMSVSVIGFGAYTDLPEDVVYEVVRILHKYQPEFVAYHYLMRVIIPDKLGEGPFTEEEVHPGAVKFYKEKGLKIGM